MIKPNKIVNRIYCTVTVRSAKSGSENFNEDYEKVKVPISNFKRCALAVGSGVMSFLDPSRGDMIALMGETTGSQSIARCKSIMSNSNEGRQIIYDKPRINSSYVDIEKLKLLNDNTLGKAYYNFLNKYGYSPDARLAVRYVEDPEMAYIVQRYREIHDLVHTVLEMPTNMLGEVSVKWVEAIQTRIPMCVTGALFGAARLAPKLSRAYCTVTKVSITLDLNMEEEKIKLKKHPGVMNVNCQKLPDKILRTMRTVIRERNIPHILEKGKLLSNYLHSRHAPYEENEILNKRKILLADVKNSFPQQMINDDVAVEEVKNYEQKIQQKVKRLLRSRLYNWKPMQYDDEKAYSYLVGRSAIDYAVVTRVFNEITNRAPDFQPKALFDFGSGTGSVSWAAHNKWADSLQEYFTVDASAEMNELALKILQDNDPKKPPFVRQLYQRQFCPASPRQYDLVVSAYSLFELPSAKARLEVINNLWNKTKQFLVLIEQGTNAGHQLIVEARDFLLYLNKKSNDKISVFAPCAHEQHCPRLKEVPQTSCNFPVKYFPFTMNSMESASSVELFSFVILEKVAPKNEEKRWPRIVRPVLLRHKHVICRMCTSSGNLEEIIITKNKHGKNLYKCSRLSNWGDLFPISKLSSDEA